MNKISYKKGLVQSAIRKKIFNESMLMQEALPNTNFMVSTKYPTQVITIDNRRYLRINEDDVEPETVDELLSTMLGIKEFKNEEDNLTEILHKSIKMNKELDGMDITKNFIKVDEFNNITNLDTIPIQKQFVADSSEEKEKEKEKIEEDTETGGDLTSQAKQLSNAINDSDKGTAEGNKSGMLYQVEEELEQTLAEVSNYENKTMFHVTESMFNTEELLTLNKFAKNLLKAFRGTKGKTKRMSPSKRMSAKDVAMDKEKVYISKYTGQGKFINMNFLIDCSGSMYGMPIRNAVAIAYIFNQLAKDGHLKMSIIYSATQHHYKLDLPAKDSEILSLYGTGSAEGLTSTVNAYVNDLRNVNLICLTDGNLADESIDKKFWEKNKIVATGVYVNSKAENLTKYTGSLNRWFNHSIVRRDIKELIQTLVRIGLK